jgi:hypothetical protein
LGAVALDCGGHRQQQLFLQLQGLIEITAAEALQP